MDVNKSVKNDENSIKGLIQISDEEYERYNVQNNDLFFTRTSETSEEIGLTSAYIGNSEKCIFSGFILRARPIKEFINSLYFAYYLRSPKMRNEIIKLSSITTRALISGKNLSTLNVKIPDIKEQEKVANFLSLVDKKIKLMEKTLVLYERFAEEFIKNIYLNLNTSNKVKLRDIVDSYVSNLSISNLDDNEGKYPLYGAEGVVKYINFYEMKNQYISIIKDGAGVGRLNLCNQDSSALGTLQCLIPKKEFDLHFIYYYLKNLNFKKYIVGSTIPHIYFKDYSKEKLNIPPLDIQIKYGKQCLTLEMKKKIIENAIVSLKQYKKYLLQNLFI